jgi:hypothetical protein
MRCAETRDAGRVPRRGLQCAVQRRGPGERSASNGFSLSSSDKECIMGTISSTAGNVAASGGSAASGGISTDAITGQIAANAQQGLEIAQAQAQASVKQAAGEALKSGASGLKDAAKAS